MIKKLFILLFLSFVTTTVSAQTVVTESTTNSTIRTDGEMTTTVKSPPP